jgi:hypothetical protein
MVFKRRMPRLACSVLTLATALSAAGFTGCDSNTEAVITPEQKNRAAEIQKAETDGTAVGKAKGKKGAQGRSIKGNIGGGAVPD